jgi:hypothetical protein
MTTIANAKQSTPIAPTTNIDVNALRHRSDLITQISLESEIAPFPTVQLVYPSTTRAAIYHDKKQLASYKQRKTARSADKPCGLLIVS